MTRKNTRAAIGVFAALCSIYVVSHFYRVSNGVIAPDLMRELDLSAEAMGTLTGAFFIAFSLTQIPVGIMLDRLGTRYTIPIMMTFAVVGSLIFAAAAGMVGLTVGRMLMGLGCSCVYVGALAVAVVGSSGATLRPLPLVFWLPLATLEICWLQSLWPTLLRWSAGAQRLWEWLRSRRLAPLSCCCSSAMRRRTTRFIAVARKGWGSIVKGVADVFRISDLPPMLVLQFFGYANVMTILGLWGGPYLHDVYGLGLEARGNVLVVMGLGLIVGSLTFGPLDRVFDTRKGVVIAGGMLAVLILVLLAVLSKPPLWLVMTLYAVFAFSNAYNVVGMAHARAIVPDHMIGRGMTVIALFTMGGVATLQIVTGLILGAFANAEGIIPEAGYRTMYGVVAACVFAGLLYYTRTADAKPSLDKASA